VDARAGLLIRYGGEFVDGVVARASGSFVETVDGQRVLDFTAGQICATVGHNHPRVPLLWAGFERSVRLSGSGKRVAQIGLDQNVSRYMATPAETFRSSLVIAAAAAKARGTALAATWCADLRQLL
jgi:acetylornithine/succinyldiaminopimelate/putrescine aminotransferase